MTKGFCFVAQNNDTTDYVKQACMLALSIHQHNKKQSVSLITNDKIPAKYKLLFDKVIPIEKDDAKNENIKFQNRCKLYDLSPYKKTIVMDVDMLVTRDITNWWSYLNNFDIFFTSDVLTYREEQITSTWHRKTFIANDLPNLYNGFWYFEKTKLAKRYFSLLKIITKHWQEFYKIYTPNKTQPFYSVDVSSAIACKILGIQDQVTDRNSFVKFVHMKPNLQNWNDVPKKWTDKVSTTVNKQGELVVGNVLQKNIFHYVENEFLSEKIVKGLETCSL